MAGLRLTSSNCNGYHFLLQKVDFAFNNSSWKSEHISRSYYNKYYERDFGFVKFYHVCIHCVLIFGQNFYYQIIWEVSFDTACRNINKSQLRGNIYFKRYRNNSATSSAMKIYLDAFAYKCMQVMHDFINLNCKFITNDMTNSSIFDYPTNVFKYFWQ